MKKALNHLLQAQGLFVLIALFFGVLFISMAPPLWGVDETSHFARVYQLAHGDLVPDRSTVNHGGEIPQNLINLSDYVKSDLLDNATVGTASRQDVDSTDMYKQLTDSQFSKVEGNYPWTAAYSPVAYAGSIVGVFFANLLNSSIGQTIFLARLGALLLYVAIVWFAIYLLRASKLKWLVFTVALLPSSLFQASVVTADNVAIGLSMLFFALFIRLMNSTGKSKDKKLFYAVVAVAALMPLVKINYLFLSLGVLLVPDKLFDTKRRAVLVKTLSVALSVFLGLLWTALSTVTSKAPAISQRPDGIKPVPSEQLSLIIHHPLHFVTTCITTTVNSIDVYLQSLISFMGWNWTTVPYAFILLICLGVIVAAVYARDELIPIRKKLLLINLLILAGVFSVFAGLYITFNPVGNRVVDSVQGRYFLPFLLPSLALLAAYVPFEVKIKDRTAPHLFVSISALGLTLSAIYFLITTY